MIEKIIGTQRTGKTYRLFAELYLDKNAIMIVPIIKMAKNQHDRYMELYHRISLEVIPRRIIAVSEYFKNIKKYKKCNIYIDNSDMVLNKIFNNKVKVITIKI
jgi:hypothetical protein